MELGISTNGLPIHPGDYIVDVTMPIVGGTVQDTVQLKGSDEPYVRITRPSGEVTIIPVAEALKIPQTDEEIQLQEEYATKLLLSGEDPNPWKPRRRSGNG